MGKTTYLAIIISALMLISCEDWLDVTPSTEVKVTDQIQSVEGFMEMLNGAYITMAQRELYGEQLMFGDIETLAQNHHPENSLTSGWAEYDYTTVQSMIRYEAYWDKLYNAIANVNIILDHIDNKRALFTEDDYNVLKGEALGIRAFLHFDVLRLFGEDYSDATKFNVQLPYVTSAELVRFRHLSLDSVYINLFQDLDRAQTLLSASDPLVASYDGFLFDLNQRIYHLNYHALHALKARVFITRGTAMDNDSAYFYASKVLTEKNWDYTDPSGFEAVGSADGDPLLSSEMIWALNVSNLPTVQEETFGSITAIGGYSTATEDFNGAEKIYDVLETGAFDLRYNNLLGAHPSDFASRSVSRKFDQEDIVFNDFDFYDYYSVPMFRTSEMILTRAEAILETDRNETINLLNELREARDVAIPDPNYTGLFNPQILEELVREYRKELFMEGQTFFIYKRLGYSQIPDGSTLSGMIDMTAAQYQLPIPADELELGNR